MKLKLYLIIYILSLVLASANAQEKSLRQIYNQAENDYEIGRVEQALTLLQDNIKDFSGNLQQSAFRLMAICWLSLDENEKAEQCTRSLLNYDPYYTTSSQDPQRFIDMVKSIKLGLTAKITTASSQAESLAEVPVPTTLITEEMIRNCGGNNLQEVLAAYVPGMHIIDCNDDINISMRGIYSNGQEKILIMLNGHRINSYTTNIAAPDFSINLDKIKQIEVLRGPASSLYGGVALTAVVNLITKQGADVDGTELRVGVGNYGQQHGSLLFGKRYFDLDLLIWGGLHSSTGQSRDIIEEYNLYSGDYADTKVGVIGEKPSYDFGVQLKWKNLHFLYDTHFSQVVSPLTISTLASTYAHDNYKTFNGISPSFSSNAHHADLSYSHAFGPLNLKGTLTFDKNDLTHYQVIYDGPLDYFGSALGFPAELDAIFKNSTGSARYINGQELAYSGNIKGDFSYINNDRHKGSISFGAELSHFKLDDVRYQIVYSFINSTPENNSLQEMGKGHENNYNTFLQLKHQWRSWILNAGLRFDHKVRYNSVHKNVLSPRVALIFLQPKWNIKFSYAKSFVDAPYLYRKSNDFMTMMQGYSPDSSEELDPETIHSFQLTFSATEWIKGLNIELNGFYNKANDLLVTHIIDYNNGGQSKIIGAELMTSYRRQKFNIDFNLTWTHTLSYNLFKDNMYRSIVDSQIDDNNNTPAIMSNAVVTWKPIQRLKLFTHLAFEGKQTSYNTDAVKLTQAQHEFELAAKSDNEEDYQWYMDHAYQLLSQMIWKGNMNARLLVNLGAEYQFGKLTLGMNVHNLFGTKYFRSGMNTKLVPQKGMWFMFNIAYKF